MADPLYPALTLDDFTKRTSYSLKFLCVTFDTKLTFGSHFRQVTAKVSLMIAMLRKCRMQFGYDEAVLKSFFGPILPIFDYCRPVRDLSVDALLKLLDRVKPS